MAYKINFTDGGVEVAFSGPFDTDELIDAKSRVWARHRAGSIKFQVVDLTGVEGPALEPEQAAQFRMMDEMVGTNDMAVRIALVVASAEIAKSANAYAAPLENEQLVVRTFTDREKARAWAKSHLEDMAS